MTKLRIAVRNYADFENALRDEAAQFESAFSDVEVEVISMGIHDLHRRTISDGGLRDGVFDLALLVTDWLAEGMATHSLEDLQKWHQRSSLPDWPEGWAASLVRPLVIEGRLTSIPWHDGPECLVYRTDLFEDPQHRRAFQSKFGRELSLPKTWEEFRETARFFTRSADHLYGTVFAAFPDGHNTLYDFALQVWSRGGELVNAEGKPQVDSPTAIEAVEFYRQVVRDPDVCHPESPDLDSTQSGDLFLRGEVAMMANWFGFAARASRPGSPLRGKVAIGPIPCSPGSAAVSLSVFWAMAMGAGSRNKEAAWEFLRFLADPVRDLGITRHGTVGVRLSTWRNPELRNTTPPYCEIERISLGARQLPAGPDMAAFAAIIDSIVTRVLTTDDPTADILREAQLQIDRKGLRFS